MAQGIVHPHSAGHAGTEKFLYGLIAEFDDAHAAVDAAKKIHEAGYRRIDGYSPFPVEGLPEACGFKTQDIPWLMLFGGIAGACGGYGLLYYCMKVAYQLNIGGRPEFGWPSAIPITFECTVLLSALTGVFAMFALNGLPQPYHPVFDAPNFERATSDRFFLSIEATDPNFELDETRRFMETLGALNVSEVELRK